MVLVNLFSFVIASMLSMLTRLRLRGHARNFLTRGLPANIAPMLWRYDLYVEMLDLVKPGMQSS